MKSYVLLVALMLSLSLSAQVKLGVKGGLNISDVHFKHAEYNPRTGWHGGVLGDFSFNKSMSIRGELLYSVKGFRYGLVGANGIGTMKFSYINLPLLFAYSPSDNWQLLLGPELGLLMAAKSSFGGNEHDVKRNFEKDDLALNIGAGYHFSRNFGAELRYSFGLAPLQEGILTDDFGNVIGEGKDGANRVLHLGVFYLLTKKR